MFNDNYLLQIYRFESLFDRNFEINFIVSIAATVCFSDTEYVELTGSGFLINFFLRSYYPANLLLSPSHITNDEFQ